MAFELPKLEYDYAALEPNIDARTMEIHHTKHHQAYITNLNNALAGGIWENKSLEEILANVSKLPVAVRNNGGGHFNHSMFWQVMGPKGGGNPSFRLAGCIEPIFWIFRQVQGTVYSCCHDTFWLRLGLAC